MMDKHLHGYLLSCRRRIIFFFYFAPASHLASPGIITCLYIIVQDDYDNDSSNKNEKKQKKTPSTTRRPKNRLKSDGRAPVTAAIVRGPRRGGGPAGVVNHKRTRRFARSRAKFLRGVHLFLPESWTPYDFITVYGYYPIHNIAFYCVYFKKKKLRPEFALRKKNNNNKNLMISKIYLK